MAVTWKKVLGAGQVVSSDLASEGNSGEVLTTNGSGSLSYTAKTVNSDTYEQTVWTINGGTASDISHGETVIIAGSGGTAVTSGGTDNRTITVTSTAIACPNTSASPTFTGTVTTASMYATAITAVQDTALTIGSGYQSGDYVTVNGVYFYGSATPAVQSSRHLGVGKIACSDIDMADDGVIVIGTGDDLKLYHDATNSYITNATGALKIATETSGIAVTIGHTTSETTVADNLTVTGTLDSGALSSVGNMALDGNFDGTGDGDFSGDVSVAGLAVGLNAVVTGDMTVSGDLTISGDTITQNVSSILVEDDEIVLLHNVANDTTDSGITFGMNTATRQSVLGHDASAQRCVVAESISGGTLADIDGFVATVETHATASPTSSNLGSGIGSFWIEEDANYLWVRVE